MKPFLSILFFAITTTFVSFARDIVPFTINPSTNQMEVEVFVNNDTVPFKFVIDTGASDIQVNARNKRLGELLNLCEIDTVDYAFGSVLAKKTPYDNNIRMGSLVADSIQIISAEASWEFDGVIGISLLRRYKLGIFSDSKILMFCTNDEQLNIPEAIELKLFEDAGLYGTDLTFIANSHEYTCKLMLDTGYGGTAAISSQFSNKYELEKILKKMGSLTSSDGAGADNDSFFASVPRTLFGGESLPLLPFEIDLDSSNSAYTAFFNGLIGFDILKRYNMVWDFKNNSIYVAPNFNFFSPIFIY